MSKGKGGSSKKSTADLVAELAQPLADELGLFLWDVRFEKEGNPYPKLLTPFAVAGIAIMVCSFLASWITFSGSPCR